MSFLSKRLWLSKYHAGRGLQWLERYLPASWRPSRAACHSFTYFFRDVNDYRDLLKTYHAQHPGELRLLSVGCATGQEPFSLALVCREAGIACSVTGVDLSTRAIAVAKQGSYDLELERKTVHADLAEDPSSGADEALRLLNQCGAWFAPAAPGSSRQMISDDIRSLVRFEVQDVCELAFHDEFDFVVCRKMLYYLPAIKRELGMNRMMAALKQRVPPSHLVFDGYTRKQPFFPQLWEKAVQRRGQV